MVMLLEFDIFSVNGAFETLMCPSLMPDFSIFGFFTGVFPALFNISDISLSCSFETLLYKHTHPPLREIVLLQ